MKENCLDIGTIQAFLDGELVHAESARVSGHIALCDTCAVNLAEAENESAIVFPALDRELNALVPTQRLWNKINDSITDERESRRIWDRALAFLSAALLNPSLAAAAGLLIVLGISVTLFVDHQTVPDEVAAVQPSRPAVPVIPASQTDTPSPPSRQIDNSEPESTRAPVQNYQKAVFRPAAARSRTAPDADRSSTAVAAESMYMPGEESYVKTITSMTRTIEGTKDGIMRPAQRISYERDMALVNDSITKLREAVKRDPRNESAKQMLYSSYQNKIDLLNSVSQKEELMASIR